MWPSNSTARYLLRKNEALILLCKDIEYVLKLYIYILTHLFKFFIAFLLSSTKIIV